MLKDQVCNGKEMAARFGVLYVIKLCEYIWGLVFEGFRPGDLCS